MDRPISFAYARPWAFGDALDLKRYPALFAARSFSCSRMNAIRRGLEPIKQDAPMVETVALAGSMGRLEANANSDFDVIVVVSNDSSLEGTHIDHALSQIFARIAATGLRAPKRWGIYRRVTSEAQLCDPGRLGSLTETPDVFGKRMGLLLDVQPVYGDGALRELQRALLEWYATGYVDRYPGAQWVYLLNDLMRYFRAYAAWQQFEMKYQSTSAWLTRIAKLKHSRLLTYAGLLCLLGECSKQRQDKIAWLSRHLMLTPLERIALVYATNHEQGLDDLVAAYEVFAAVMADAVSVADMVVRSPQSLEELPPRIEGPYGAVNQAAADLKAELTRFVLARQRDWASEFFNYLLF